MSKISQYTPAGTVAANDLLVMVDVSDTTMGSSGTTKKMTMAQLPAVAWFNAVSGYGADPTGATDSTTAISSAITAAQSAGQGIVYLPRGTYLTTSTITVSQSGIYLVGDGLWATTINFTGTGDALRWYDASAYTSRTVHGGGPSGISVSMGSAGSGSCALHAGDILRLQFAITVEGAGSANSTGIHLDNQNYWCEQAAGTAYVDSCTQDVVFDCSGAATSTGSYDRGDFTFYLSHKTFLGDCITWQNGAIMVGGRLRIYGNINSSAASFTQAVLTLTGSAPGGHPSSTSSLTNCDIQINAESDEGLAHTFQTINFGGSSNILFDCSGNISFGAGNQFTASNVSSTTAQFVFQGPVVGDSTLSAQCIINRLAIFSTSSFFGIPTFQAPLLIDEHAAPSTPTGGGYVYVDVSGNLHYLGPGGGNTTLAQSGAAPAASVSYTPANPAGTTSGTVVLMGLGTTCTFTPRTTGKVMATVSGTWYTATGTTQGTLSGRFGTGTAPANGAADAGTRWGTGASDWTIKAASAGFGVPFSMTQIVSLTAGTAYWFDLAESTSSNLDATTTGNVVMTLAELPA